LPISFGTCFLPWTAGSVISVASAVFLFYYDLKFTNAGAAGRILERVDSIATFVSAYYFAAYDFVKISDYVFDSNNAATERYQ
jgi:hypothetical protein